MHTASPVGRRVLYSLVFLSGCAGLIYQVVWHKYLTILLGAQARATAIVLAIFLGGISLGYTSFGRWSRYKQWNLLKAYALVELALGVWALLFPGFFRSTMPLVPHLYGVLGLNSIVIDVLVSVLLLGVPTFLMGGTLPLLTQGVSEDLSEASSAHAKIYGYNTVGACLGSVIAGYVLIPTLSLPITVIIGGCLNVLIAGLTYFLFAKSWTPPPASENAEAREAHPAMSQRGALILAVGFLSGFYILTLETVFIRLVGLSTGSSNYTFTLIVSIFVFGLGCGSLLVRRISRYSEAHLLWNQLGIALSLFFLYLTGDSWPYWVHLIRILFRDIPLSFYFYQAALGAAFLLLMVVPVGLCGLTLPYCFHLLKDRKETLGHRVGQLYGLNTVGCVMGALVGGYFLLYYFNLDQIFKICIGTTLVSTALAAWLYSMRFRPSTLQISLGSSGLAVLLAAVVLAPSYVKERYFQPFRVQFPTPVDFDGADAFARHSAPETSYLMYKDGPNVSIGVAVRKVEGKEAGRALYINGKSDGSTRSDFFTMSMTGHIPAILARKLDRVGIIGIGTGLTIGAIAEYQDAKALDVIEISGTIIDSAHYFDMYNGGVSTNPKIRFHEMDAFRFLEGTRENFDVIVSEPSNVWMAGIENLYTAELYGLAKRKLNPGGMYFQWLHAYSLNDDLFRMVLRTITSQFAHVSVFQMMEHDFLLVATDEALTRKDLERSFARLKDDAPARRLLEKTGITRFESVLAMEFIPAPLSPVLGSRSPLQRLEVPRLSHGAARAFFVNSAAEVETMRRQSKQFFPAVQHSLLSLWTGQEGVTPELMEAFRETFCTRKLSRSRVLCEEALVMSRFVKPGASAESIYEDALPATESRDLASAGTRTQNFSDVDLLRVKKAFDLFKKNTPASRIPASPIIKRFARSQAMCEQALSMARFMSPDASTEAVLESAMHEPEISEGQSPSTPLQSYAEGDLARVGKMFEFYKKYYSPIARIPSSPLLTQLDSCLRLVPAAQELYGDCLLHKLGVLEYVAPAGPAYRNVLSQYTEWFAKLPTSSENYQRFLSARHMVERAIRELEAEARRARG